MREPIKTKVMAIVHGKSEYCLCTSIRSNLRIKHRIIARDKGRESIQVTSIMDVLKNKQLKSFAGFKHSFGDIACEKKALLHFRLFIMMDVDDCTEEEKRCFINKEMFKEHWLYDSIVPIYNDPNLEAVMAAIGIPVKKKMDYITFFPTNHGDLDMQKAIDFRDRLKACRCTNMEEYVKYCIEIAEENLHRFT